MRVLEFEAVHFRYRSGRGVEAIAFGLCPGEVLGILGPNGSGKSTIARLAVGLLRPQRGSVRLFGGQPGIYRGQFRQVGFAGDRPTHWEKLSGWQEAWFFARQYGLSREEARRRLERLFSFWGLQHVQHEHVRHYSFGMRKRLSLLEATVHAPPLLVLDEPTLGLDLDGRQRLKEMLEDPDVAVLVASNDVDMAEHLCQRVLLLHQGRIVAEGSPSELVARLGERVQVEVELRTAIPVDRLRQNGWCDGLAVTEEGFRAILRRGLLDLSSLIDATVSLGGEIRNIRVSEPSLADVYLKLTGEVLE